MRYEIGNIYCDDFMNNGLPDKSVQLIIADPPYFEVKGDFDFIWNSFDDYLADVEKWAKECKRILADNGTLFWYGDAKKIAYSQVILDKYFNLQNSMVWRKVDSMQYQYYSPDLARSFNTHNERILMYDTEKDMTGLEKIKNDADNFKSLREYFKEYQFAIGLNKKQIIDIVGQKADHCFRWDSTQWDLPTPETYDELGKIPLKNKFIRKEHEFVRKEYEELRKEYEDQRRYFYNPMKYEEVLEFSQQGAVSKNYDHDTVKPEKMTSALITTCSRPGDIVFVPFSGSGTECAMAQREGRRYIGFDVCEKYVVMGNERCKKEKEQPSLFDATPSKDLTKPVDAPTLFED